MKKYTLEEEKIIIKKLKSLEIFLEDITEPTDKIIKAALMRNGHNLRFVENPTNEQIQIALMENGFALRYVKNPTDEQIKIALGKNGIALKNVDKPTDEQIKIALIEDAYALRYVKNPTDEQIKFALKRDGYQDGYILRFVDKPTDEQVKIAIKQSPLAISYVNNPSKEIIDFYKKCYYKDNIIYGYKGFDIDMQCMGLQYQVGETRVHKDIIIPCKSGFHFCKDIRNIMQYGYYPKSSIYARVKSTGNYIEHEDKIVADKLEILEIVDYDTIITE